LLIIRDLAGGPRRFVELQRVLPGISTEQLRSRLNRMVADGLLTRQRYREVPPRVDYELTERAQELMPVLGALARWGQDWAWGVPREGEAIDVGAIFRLAPGLLSPARSLRGTTELVVTDRLKDGSTCHYSLETSGGRVQIFERTSPDAEARVTADEASWVRALGPDDDRSGLSFEGDERLAGALLDGLTESSGGESAASSAAA
jgi:DNA-binding HxlR family transcriptional regulator